ncbi:LptF/LptG family permease [Commensalibacter oyaizuii]|uniref:LptF/LptG family permease n=1 Tax=Commensalibacter oyaizuii TaxID=3043873 RepID=A0ABT6Q1M3_9PROT|nr:LptF/LptG family permease [Commensalibacter sp. TBRC 16381]MDI2091007.1 LptF/LptG family permease [Commensalibacter sp. TBRC 16381]
MTKSWFKKHTLIIYLSIKLLGTVLGTAILLTAIMEALALLDQMSVILERHLGIMGVVHYMALRLPLLFSSILPLSMLIGSIITLTQLTINNEITMLRSAGLSAVGLLKKLLPVTLFISVICFLFYDQITPKTELNLAIWWNKTNPTPEKGKSFYFYQKLDIINVDYIAYGGNKISGLTVIKRHDLSHLRSILTADSATYQDHQWILSNAKILEINPSIPLKFKKLTAYPDNIWPIEITPRTLVELSSPTIPQSIQSMFSQLSNVHPFRTPTNNLKTSIWERFFLPFTFVIMLVIAVPVTYIPPRAGFKSWLPIYCLGCGLLFIIFQEVLRALGKAGTLPAPVAIIPSFIIFLFATSTIILMIEEKQ